MAPYMAADNFFISTFGTRVFRQQSFSDIHHKSLPLAQPALRPDDDTTTARHGLYVHLGNNSSHYHKATLELKYGIRTEYVDELQLKWQQLKVLGAKDLAIPNPSQPSPEGYPRFDPLEPDPSVWNNFYIDRRDAIMSEIFTKCLDDKESFQRLMEAVFPFWQARQQNQRVHKGNEVVRNNVALVVANGQLVTECYSQIFDYLELIMQSTPSPQPLPNDTLNPGDLAAIHILRETMGQNGLIYVQAFKYVGQMYISWLQNVCRNNKPSPSSGTQHLLVAPDMVKSLESFPSFNPVETFVQRFEEYRRMTSRFADWMRVKFSREDYLLRLKYAHSYIMPTLPDDVLTMDRETLKTIDSMKDEYVQILCVVWSKLCIRPEPWMMHFSHPGEAIRQAAQQRLAGAPGFAAANQGSVPGGAGDNNTAQEGNSQNR
jgi:hypothetical protein